MIYDYIMFWLFDTRSCISLVTLCIFSIKRKLTVVIFGKAVSQIRSLFEPIVVCKIKIRFNQNVKSAMFFVLKWRKWLLSYFIDWTQEGNIIIEI